MRNKLDQILDKKYLDALMVAEMVNQPIHILGPDSSLLFVNKAWSVTYGIPAEEAIGRNDGEY